MAIPKGSSRPRSRWRGLLSLTLILGLLLATIAPRPALASSSWIWFDMDGSSYREFGANQAIVIDGRITYTTGCAPGGINDFVYPFANIYIVSDGAVSGSSRVGLSDVSGSPNTVMGTGGGLFLGETIGYTGPGGSIGNGAYDIVIDECQDGYFDPGVDYILGAGSEVAFRVNIAADVPALPIPGLAAIKAQAEQQKEEWIRLSYHLTALFILADTWDLVSAILSPPSAVIWIAQNIAGSYLPDVKLGTIMTVLNMAARYQGIANDPPDPNFRHLVTLSGLSPLAPHSDDPLITATAALGNAADEEQRIAEALLAALEKYQGAQLASDGTWALVHAREIQGYATQLTEQLGRTNQGLTAVRTALAGHPADFEQVNADILALQARVGAEGFTLDELKLLMGLGHDAAAIEAMREQFLATDYTWSRAATLAALDDLIQLNNESVAAYQELTGLMEPIIAHLEGQTAAVDLSFPTADAGGPYTAQTGGAITFDGSDSAPATGRSITTYAWDLDGNGAFDDATGATVTHSYAKPFTGQIGLKVTDNQGRQAVAYAMVTATSTNQAPVLGGLAPANRTFELKPGESQSFTASAADPDGDAVTLTWYVDEAPAGSGGSFTYSPQEADAGLHYISVVARDGVAESRATWLVAVSADVPLHPSAAFTANPDRGTAPLTVHFDGSASLDLDGEIVAYAWDFGDGSTGSGVTTTHSYATDGLYTVTLTVTDNDGATGSTTRTIGVNRGPVAAFTATPNSGQRPLTVAFDASASTDADGSIVAYAWDFGDGSTGSGLTATHTYRDAGIYTVTLTVTDNDGGTDSATESITVLPRFAAAISADREGQNAALLEAGANVLSFSSRSGTTTGPDRALTWNVSSTYWQTATGQNADQWAIMELARGQSYLIDRVRLQGFNSYYSPADFEVRISNTTADPEAFRTVFAGQIPRDANWHQYRFPAVEARYVQLILKNNHGTLIGRTENYIRLYGFQVLTPQRGGAVVQFMDASTSEGAALTSWAWDFGDGATSAERNPTHTYGASGQYTVTLTITDAEGRTDTTSLTHEVLRPPTVSIGLPTNVREGVSARYNDTSTDDGSIIAWLWGAGDGTANATTTVNYRNYAYNDNGTYTVTLTVTDNDGLTASGTAEVSVANQPPTANAGGNQSTPWGVAVTPSAASASDPGVGDRSTLQCRWDLGDGTTVGPGLCANSAILRPSHTYANPGTYTRTLTVTDKDGASTTASATVTVTRRGAEVAYTGPRTGTAGEPVTLRARLRDLLNNGPVAGRNVTFTVNGQSYTATSDASGIASTVVTGLAAGDYAIHVAYDGDSHYTGRWDRDRLLIDIEGEALVTTAASATASELMCTDTLGVLLEVIGTATSARTVPLDITLVIDISGSMGTVPMTAAREAARSFVRILDRESDGALDGIIQGSRISVVPFESVASVGVPQTADAAALDAFINSLRATGGTAIDAGIRVGQGELVSGGKPGNKPIMILLSDGGSSRPQAIAAANAAKAAGTEIFSIGLGTGADEQLLRDIASAPWEEHYFFTPDNNQLEAIYAAIASSATGPTATDLVITAQVHPDFALDAASISPAPTSVDGNTITWTLPVILGERRGFSFEIGHRSGAGGGEKPLLVGATLTYTDTRGERQTKQFDGLTALVNCPVVVEYTGETSGVTGGLATLAARLTDAGSGAALAGQVLAFTLGDELSATVTTDPNGVATVTLPLSLAAGLYDLVVAFGGAPGHLPGAAQVEFTVLEPGDELPPVTTIHLDGLAGNAGWWRSEVTVTLTAVDPADANGRRSGVDKTEYRLNGAAYQLYGEPFLLTEQGATLVEAFSTDLDGNQEAPPVSATVRIDSVAPVPAATVSGGGDVFTLDASGSVDTGSGIFGYAWDLDGDGVYETEGAQVSYQASGRGTYTVTLRVTDVAGNQATLAVTIEVGNSAPAVAAGPDRSIDEGSSLVLSASFTDPDAGDTHTATVNWGDGQSESVAIGTGGVISASHAYGDDGVHTVIVTVCDQHGACGEAAFALVVVNVAPSVVIEGEAVISARVGETISLTGQATDPGADDLTFTWTWGDGAVSGESFESGGTWPVAATHTASHAYGSAGTYTVVLTVTDDDGGSASTTVTVVITAAAEEGHGPRTIGFWGHQFARGRQVHVDAETLMEYIGVINQASGIFSEVVQLQTLDDGAAVLESAQRTMWERGVQQTFALWLNVAHGGLTMGQMVDTDGDGLPDMTVGEALAMVEAILLDPGAGDGAYEQAKDIADRINNMGH